MYYRATKLRCNLLRLCSLVTCLDALAQRADWEWEMNYSLGALGGSVGGVCFVVEAPSDPSGSTRLTRHALNSAACWLTKLLVATSAAASSAAASRRSDSQWNLILLYLSMISRPDTSRGVIVRTWTRETAPQRRGILHIDYFRVCKAKATSVPAPAPVRLVWHIQHRVARLWVAYLPALRCLVVGLGRDIVGLGRRRAKVANLFLGFYRRGREERHIRRRKKTT